MEFGIWFERRSGSKSAIIDPELIEEDQLEA
jgi:hypothetical protein